MRIRLRRSGGFAGLQAPPIEIDAAQLPADKAGELEQLVAAARLFDAPVAPAGAQPSPPAPPASPARDAFQYDLTVEDGGDSRAVRFHEGTMRPEAARLIQWLTQESGQK
ncbi:MAG TPA: protealysin inhibitor emfourin [Thermoanaerobaculia bacterium]|jgi:hypothetical protein|nr:protealysin inhibitor emfourin [Thermoanaerobaculia bacterium]